MKRILAIHAHPDDCEILAGGTLALLAAQGHAITIATMTPGDCGSAELSLEEISRVRRQEARDAAAVVGAEYRCLEFRDLMVFDDDASRRQVTDLLRRTQPDLILTASPVDYMIDHETTSLLVRNACFAAPVRNYGAGDFDPPTPLAAIPHLYYMDPIGGVDRDGVPITPDFTVDIASTFETKKQMLDCHRSQREWLRKQHGLDEYLATMERWSREIGRRAGLSFGEGFRRHKGHPYPQSPLLEELLGPDVVRPRQ